MELKSRAGQILARGLNILNGKVTIVSYVLHTRKYQMVLSNLIRNISSKRSWLVMTDHKTFHSVKQDHQRSQVHQQVYLEGNLQVTRCRFTPSVVNSSALRMYQCGTTDHRKLYKHQSKEKNKMGKNLLHTLEKNNLCSEKHTKPHIQLPILTTFRTE